MIPGQHVLIADAVLTGVSRFLILDEWHNWTQRIDHDSSEGIERVLRCLNSTKP